MQQEKNILFDTGRSFEERIQWLLKSLTADIDFLLPEGVAEGALTLCLTGDVQSSLFKTIQPPEGCKISLGIAN